MFGGSLLALAAALALDRLVGDPAWLWNRLPHPVALIGAAIQRLETASNRLDQGFAARRVRGIAALIVLVAGGACCAAVIDALARTMPFGAVIETLVVAVFLAQKSLLDHVRRVARRSERGAPTPAVRRWQ
jgi:adenosylcobinamide-phosphate synthase